MRAGTKVGRSEALAGLAAIQPSLAKAAQMQTGRALKLNQGRRPRKHPEQDFQAQLVIDLTAILSAEVFFFAVPNGGWRSLVEAAILIGQGVKSGVPDLVFIYQGRAYGLELKAPRGYLSKAQRETFPKLERAGMQIAQARTLDDALAALKLWGIPTRIKGGGA